MLAAGNEKAQKSRGRRIIVIIPVALVLSAATLALVALVFGPAVKSVIRAKAAEALQERFESKLQYTSFDISFFPRFEMVLRNVAFRRTRDSADLPPLIQAGAIQMDATIGGLLRRPVHVRRVSIDGFAVHIPKGHRDRSEDSPSTRSSSKSRHFPVVMDELVADSAVLMIIRKSGEKPPLEFDIHRLRMMNFDLNQPAAFEAALTNPRPVGEIKTAGTFGPWEADEPSLTPVAGSYKFSLADLATLKGIGGILSSTGKYDGVLERIVVDGETDTPGFYLDITHHPVPLRTKFHAIVDGTNGNTSLQPVKVVLGNSSFVNNGEVVKMPEVKGRRVTLDVVMDQGRLQDLLRLAVKSDRPPLDGTIRLRAKMDLPPGEQDVIQKLRLDGQFEILAAHFSSLNIREKLRALSRKGQGAPEDPTAGSAVSNLRGSFRLRNGLATFSNLTFELEGASVDLAGRYNLTNEELDFRGNLDLDAKISETTTGVKAFFLKAVDPLFRNKNKGHGSRIPISITGTRNSPSFGLDLGEKF